VKLLGYLIDSWFSLWGIWWKSGWEINMDPTTFWRVLYGFLAVVLHIRNMHKRFWRKCWLMKTKCLKRQKSAHTAGACFMTSWPPYQTYFTFFYVIFFSFSNKFKMYQGCKFVCNYVFILVKLTMHHWDRSLTFTAPRSRHLIRRIGVHVEYCMTKINMSWSLRWVSILIQHMPSLYPDYCQLLFKNIYKKESREGDNMWLKMSFIMGIQ